MIEKSNKDKSDELFKEMMATRVPRSKMTKRNFTDKEIKALAKAMSQETNKDKKES